MMGGCAVVGQFGFYRKEVKPWMLPIVSVLLSNSRNAETRLSLTVRLLHENAVR